MSSPLRTALIAFGVAMALVVVCVALGRAIPFVGANLGAVVAVVFLYVPVYFAWRRKEDLADYGFRLEPVGKGLAYGLGASAVIFPLFALAFVGFYEVVCASGSLAALAPPGFCARWDGLGGARWPSLGWGFAEAAFVQVVVVALPEELFFRGFLHELCERALPPKRRFLGGGIGWALVISSALFAVGHLAAGFDPRRLAVFFPGLLFGWMRSATGSILAGTIAHALSNLYIDLLQRAFF